jgi:hypothetical protein
MAEMKRRRAEREKAKSAKEAAEAADGQTGSEAQGEEAVKEAEKIAGQASATKVKRRRAAAKSGSKGSAPSKKARSRTKR